ncbi:helix-turn-helix domain-containing protein [Mediterraneibacter gnavus]|uniref:helix-turn-helix domain-containing protein n=1 Tax=Mediterraneibacter gnavus TaxID=33038 RepID=UPI001D04C7E1|nr:helix-turn-helix transcriptional regulator [Mediterraneibacter gnavus]MCB5652899.1 helix-turn-helix domain-containing protein [Mediterraneibacter gnavus]MDB8711637.1 helix-turn-helix transcriptional regulator [Mediterraneibacter gnavus]MDB8714647.1 helix-turn-helix transcriptional regulator [Mediterraneibacter gnavus]
MIIYERIKELRKELGLNQEEFGERLGVSRSVIANIEYDRLKRPDQKESLYKLICKEFNVSEEWLRTGNGEMFVPLTRNQLITDFASDLIMEDNTFKKRLVEALAKLDEDEWEVLEKLAESLIKKD